jgi:hypothetical protein
MGSRQVFMHWDVCMRHWCECMVSVCANYVYIGMWRCKIGVNVIVLFAFLYGESPDLMCLGGTLGWKRRCSGCLVPNFSATSHFAGSPQQQARLTTVPASAASFLRCAPTGHRLRFLRPRPRATRGWTRPRPLPGDVSAPHAPAAAVRLPPAVPSPPPDRTTVRSWYALNDILECGDATLDPPALLYTRLLLHPSSLANDHCLAMCDWGGWIRDCRVVMGFAVCHYVMGLCRLLICIFCVASRLARLYIHFPKDTVKHNTVYKLVCHCIMSLLLIGTYAIAIGTRYISMLLTPYHPTDPRIGTYAFAIGTRYISMLLGTLSSNRPARGLPRLVSRL